jgi:hypothetical protein
MEKVPDEPWRRRSPWVVCPGPVSAFECVFALSVVSGLKKILKELFERRVVYFHKKQMVLGSEFS